MKTSLNLAATLSLILMMAGCMTTPVKKSGGPGSITISNTNPRAIRSAAQQVFPRYGYSQVASNFPQSLAFERPAGRTGELFFGSHGQTTTFRARLQLIPISGTPDFRITTQVSRVNNARMPGFEQETPMLRSWSGQFKSILRDIQAKAANAGPGL